MIKIDDPQGAARTTLLDSAGRLIGWIIAPSSPRPLGRKSGTVLLVRPRS